MKKQIARWGLLVVIAAFLSGMTLACKSSTKPPAMPPSAEKASPDNALAIADGHRVTMDFTASLSDKTVIASSVGKQPLTFIQGKHEIAPAALETALLGMKAGEQKTVALTAEQAYGPYDEKKKQTVKAAQLPPGTKVGSQVRNPKSGEIARVIDITDDSAVIDFNHRLAGKDLIIEVTILKVER